MVLNRIKFALVAASLIILSSPLLRAQDSAADIEAMNELGEDIAAWWNSLPKQRPQSLSVLQVGVNQKLSADFPRIAEDILLSKLSRIQNTRAIACFECRRPQITVKGDRLIVTKGVPNQQTLLELAQKLELDSFMTVYVTKTVFSLRALIIIQNAASGEIFASKEFSVSNVALYDTSMHFIIANGLLWDLVPKTRRKEGQSVPFNIEFSWLQSIGRYTRVGLTGAGIFFAQSGHVGYIAPKISWKFQLGRSVFSLAPAFQTGYGFRLPGSVPGLVAREFNFGLVGGLSLDLYMGQIFFIGAKTDAYMPFNIKNSSHLTFYPGFHLGMAIGG